MSSLENAIGASTSKPSAEFHWSFYISDEELNSVGYANSPIFSFSHSSWYLRMFPKGISFTCSNWISLFLKKKNSQSEEHVLFSLVMMFQGIELSHYNGNHTFNKNENYCGCNRFVPREEILRRLTTETKEDCRLTIKIRLISIVPANVKKNMKQDIKIMRQDYKDLLLHDTGHDLILMVKDEEFKVHQNIMQFRCPVFKLMFAHNMLEKNRGVVEIPDCDPLAFKQFLFYVYTGTLETLDESVMVGLYYIADKYNMAYLKELCCQFIKKCLSAHNVIDVIRLALNHSDSSLYESAKIYFDDNIKEVLFTTEWKSFIKDNPILANELFYKDLLHLCSL